MLPIHTSAHYLLVEAVLAGLTFLAVYWRSWQTFSEKIESHFVLLSQKPVTCFSLLVLTGIAIRVVFLLVNPVPTPLAHDEFSYLLAGDTFSIGRITNPQPPVPAAFEAFHVNLWPTYQSMYMPGVGFFLAVGYLLGNPWLGVLLATSLFCGMVYWAVSGWLPRTYALATGILALSICFNWNWWFDNYFCIAAQGIGGALVIGSVPRILRKRTWTSALPFGFGSVLLLLTRPYEGAIVAIPCAVALLWHLRKIELRHLLFLTAVPTVLLAITISWLCYYDWKSTGNPLLLPYKLNYLQYHTTGPFVFSPLKRIPVYHHEQMKEGYLEWEMRTYRLLKDSPLEFMRLKAKVYYQTFFRGCGLIFLIGLYSLWRRGSPRWIVAFAFLVFTLGTIIVAWFPYPQYGAPAAALFFLVIAYGFFRLRHMQFGRFSGAQVLRGFLFAQIILSISIFYQRVEHRYSPAGLWYAEVERPRVENIILRNPGKHLVLVRYAEDHPRLEEWIYNEADLNKARIVWARSMDFDSDRKLIAGFPGRQVWLLEPDKPEKNLGPYHLPEADFALMQSPFRH